MKTFRKKMISLMLVALMLISAMPFAAFADETEATEATVEETVNTYNESGNDDNQVALEDAPGTKKNMNVVVTGDLEKTTTGSFYTDIENRPYSEQLAAFKAIVGATWKNYKYEDGDFSFSYEKDTSTLTLTVAFDNEKHTKHDMKIVKAGNTDHPGEVPTDDVHYYVCSICGYVESEIHKFSVSDKNADYHNEKCGTCNYTRQVDHADKDFYKSIGSDVAKGTVMDDGNGGEEFTVTSAARDASCTKRAAYAAIKYNCGYAVGGGEYGDLLTHDYDSNDKCRMCGKSKDGEVEYTVNINVTNGTSNPIISGKVYLTKTDVNNIRANISGAQTIMNRMTCDGDDDARNAVNAYLKSMSTYFVDMSMVGEPIEIYVRANLLDDSSVIDGTRGKILIIDGEESYERDLNIGRYYFDQIKLTDKNRDLVAMKITKTNKSTRTIYKNTTGSDAKVQDDDISCELIWDANIVTLKFYRHAGGGAMLLETRQIRAGERIDSLPMLDGKVVNWYLPSGEPLQEGRVYDFKDTTVNVYPKTSSGAAGDVYLLVYKNGDTKTAVDATPINITQYMQANGLISRADLKKVIEGKVKGDKIYLFDYEGWEDYKDSKNTRSSADVFNIGNSTDRGNVFLYAMVTGASTSGSGSSSKADGSNPKTGDNAQLGTAAAVMAVAVIGLGATTVVLKKKEII